MHGDGFDQVPKVTVAKTVPVQKTQSGKPRPLARKRAVPAVTQKPSVPAAASPHPISPRDDPSPLFPEVVVSGCCLDGWGEIRVGQKASTTGRQTASCAVCTIQGKHQQQKESLMKHQGKGFSDSSRQQKKYQKKCKIFAFLYCQFKTFSYLCQCKQTSY